jgi:anti-sigma regulatory factor (Ser/Thr protein kinase)
MSGSLRVEGRESRTVRIRVSPSADFRGVLHAFDAVELPRTKVGAENLKFAVLELVNNSIRAHKEREERRDILIDFTMTGGELHIAVRDFGGGFDPGRLPYAVDADPSVLDLHSEAFQEYREKNGNKRFGMGIYLAKKTFERFQLMFLDGKATPVPWAPEKVEGTLIRMGLRTALEEAEGE